ncbi:Os03g0424132 [Oryza sativa Japonica Group]|uniref:Os03g0424132 protein n=1 Tax=Oryza sativa subsp. japonica TaxID=39947 RepID=A0A0P0VYV4_ORYSJ|nr:Os03g0424132 [Oryza sativa Japonica Group]
MVVSINGRVILFRHSCFVLVMDTFAALCNTVVTKNTLSPLASAQIPLRASLYADDAIIILHPSRQDVEVIQFILKLMGEATGLISNLAKNSFTPINCSETKILECSQPEWLWASFAPAQDKKAEHFLAAGCKMVLGDGNNIFFWTDN